MEESGGPFGDCLPLSSCVPTPRGHCARWEQFECVSSEFLLVSEEAARAEVVPSDLVGGERARDELWRLAKIGSSSRQWRPPAHEKWAREVHID